MKKLAGSGLWTIWIIKHWSLSMVQARQVKAARALLGWSQDDLAVASKLSLATICNFESEGFSPRSTTSSLLRQAIEIAGLEFIEPDGLRFRPEEIKIFRGPDSGDQLLGDMARSMEQKGGEVLSLIRLSEVFVRLYGSNSEFFEKLQGLSSASTIKVITAGKVALPPASSKMHFLSVPMHSIGAVSFFAYADKHAVVLPYKSGEFRFIVFNLAGLAQAYREHFNLLWKNASSLSG